MVGPNTVAINLTLHCTVGEQGHSKHGGNTIVTWWILDAACIEPRTPSEQECLVGSINMGA